MPRLPRVPLDSAELPPAASPPPGPPPSPTAYRQKNPYEPPPGDYKPPSMLAEHKGLAILFIVAVLAFALYCWKVPHHRSAAIDAATPPAAGGAASSRPQTSQPPIYIETVPDSKER